MKKKINLLSISLDKNIALEEYADAQARQKDYAKHLSNYCIIILTTKKDNLKTRKIGNLTIVPTNSSLKIFSILDSLKIAIKNHKTTPFDVVTAQDPIATGLIGVLIKYVLRIPLNIQLHSEFILSQEWLNERLRNRILKPMIEWILHRADSIRVDNQAKINKLRRLYPKLKVKIFTAPMRVDLNFFWKNAKKKKKIRHFVSVGRLSAEKNFPLLIKTFKDVIAKHPNARLTIIGGGDEGRKLDNLINTLKLRNKVTLTGSLPREEVRKKLHQADAFVLSSNYEGWGLVFVEAFAAGLPMISTKVASTGELVINNENGYVVPVGDAKVLSEKIISLINDSQQAYRFARNGQKLVKEKFDQDKLVRLWINGLYETVNK